MPPIVVNIDRRSERGLFHLHNSACVYTFLLVFMLAINFLKVKVLLRFRIWVTHNYVKECGILLRPKTPCMNDRLPPPPPMYMKEINDHRSEFPINSKFTATIIYHFHIHPQFIHESFHINYIISLLSRENMNSQLTLLPMCGFNSSVVRAAYRYRGGHGFESR